MKNLLKSGLFVLGISVSVLSCDPPHSSSGKTVIDTTQSKTDSPNKVSAGTTKKDTLKK